MSDIVLDVDNLHTHFFTRRGLVRAVDGVSFRVRRGEVLGLIGESGSGKSVTGFSVLRLVDAPGRIVKGRINFLGQDMARLSEEEMRALRGSRIAMIFQDPMMTLNPVLRIDTQMIDAVMAHESVSRSEARIRARDALGKVGIPSPDERLKAYPHQFSGGMRQRVAIAIAMLHRRALLIADEPTPALDVTIYAGSAAFHTRRKSGGKSAAPPPDSRLHALASVSAAGLRLRAPLRIRQGGMSDSARHAH